MPDDPTDFGQEKQHTCSVACLRRVIWCYGINHSEQELTSPSNLRAIMPENVKGNTPEEVAEAAFKLGFVPCLRCLSGSSWMLGDPLCRQEWVKEDSQRSLEQWVKKIVKKKGMPVIVAVDTRQLGGPYDSTWGGPHSIVITKIDDDTVEYLETDSPQQKEYPKRGEYRSLKWKTFLKAWKAVECAAVLIAREDKTAGKDSPESL